jgi:hypothetical protein
MYTRRNLDREPFADVGTFVCRFVAFVARQLGEEPAIVKSFVQRHLLRLSLGRRFRLWIAKHQDILKDH